MCSLFLKLSTFVIRLSGGTLDTPLADLVKELGYGFTSSLEECRGAIIKLGGRDIAPSTVARVLAVMCRTHTGLEDSLGNFKNQELRSSWNIEIFVQSLKEVSPSLQWNNVVAELDHPEFVIKDRQGLFILISALRQGFQALGFHPDTFPVDQFYKRWGNVDGQFSLIQQILKNPDVFCFGDYPCALVTVETLKTPPEPDGKDLSNWRSLNLIELLLNMSEYGLYNPVQELFKTPLHRFDVCYKCD